MTKRYKYYRNTQMIRDTLTDERFQGNKKTCDELNRLNDKSDQFSGLLYPYEMLMRKYEIESIGELDQIVSGWCDEHD